MDKRKPQLQSMLAEYAKEVLLPMADHFHTLSAHLGKDLVRQLAVAMIGAKLKLDAIELGRPLSADAMPDPTLMQQAADAALWPAPLPSAEADIPFDCAKLITVDAAAAVRKLMKTHCGTRGRRRLPEGPARAEGGRHA